MRACGRAAALPSCRRAPRSCDSVFFTHTHTHPLAAGLGEGASFDFGFGGWEGGLARFRSSKRHRLCEVRFCPGSRPQTPHCTHCCSTRGWEPLSHAPACMVSVLIGSAPAPEPGSWHPLLAKLRRFQTPHLLPRITISYLPSCIADAAYTAAGRPLLPNFTQCGRLAPSWCRFRTHHTNTCNESKREKRMHVQ